MNQQPPSMPVPNQPMAGMPPMMNQQYPPAPGQQQQFSHTTQPPLPGQKLPPMPGQQYPQVLYCIQIEITWRSKFLIFLLSK